MLDPLCITLIRHSITDGNLKHRYIGSTDEPLCAEGVLLARRSALYMRNVEQVFTSPMLRCIQTAGLLFPDKAAAVCDGLEEMDFGIFENKSYDELCTLPEYQRWISSNGSVAPESGESMADFSARCKSAFSMTVKRLLENGAGSAAFVLHGGVIMAIMSQLVGGEIYDWQCKNCCGFEIITPDGAAFSLQNRVAPLEAERGGYESYSQ